MPALFCANADGNDYQIIASYRSIGQTTISRTHFLANSNPATRTPKVIDRAHCSGTDPKLPTNVGPLDLWVSVHDLIQDHLNKIGCQVHAFQLGSAKGKSAGSMTLRAELLTAIGIRRIRQEQLCYKKPESVPNTNWNSTTTAMLCLIWFLDQHLAFAGSNGAFTETWGTPSSSFATVR